MELSIALLTVFALGFGVGYGVRERIRAKSLRI
jgi:hypothetical protein